MQRKRCSVEHRPNGTPVPAAVARQSILAAEPLTDPPGPDTELFPAGDPSSCSGGRPRKLRGSDTGVKLATARPWWGAQSVVPPPQGAPQGSRNSSGSWVKIPDCDCGVTQALCGWHRQQIKKKKTPTYTRAFTNICLLEMSVIHLCQDVGAATYWASNSDSPIWKP